MKQKAETMWLPVQLSHDEIKTKGESLARKSPNLRRLESDQKSSAAEYTKQLKSLNREIGALAYVVENGKQYRDVQVTAEFFPEQNLAKIFRKDTGELVETRPMTAKEYQREFFDENEDVILSDEAEETADVL